MDGMREGWLYREIETESDKVSVSLNKLDCALCRESKLNSFLTKT